MKRTTTATSCPSRILLGLFLSMHLPSLVSAQEARQTSAESSRRMLQDGEATEGLFAEPVVCPGPDCVELDDVTYYSESTGYAQQPALCYKPPHCVNDANTTGESGCPLYVWLDGTSQNEVLEIPDKYFLREMVDRGFVSCVAKYDDSPVSYLEGCPSFQKKAKDIFDPNQEGSLLSQLCRFGSHADCELGLAVHGWGQGAHLAVLAADYVEVTASLQFGNGNLNGVLFVETNITCVNSENINARLPPPRRRSIVGEEDQFFNRPSVYYQQKTTAGYDCGDGNNCLGRLPDGCPGSFDAFETSTIKQCASSGQFFHSNCPTFCPYTSVAICDGVYTPYACPIYVPDAVTGGYIEDSGGYYIVPGEDHGFFLQTTESLNFTNALVAEASVDARYEFKGDFLNASMIWGLKQSFDWLDRTARYVKAVPSSLIPMDQIIETTLDMVDTDPSKILSDIPSDMPSGAPSLQPSQSIASPPSFLRKKR